MRDDFTDWVVQTYDLAVEDQEVRRQQPREKAERIAEEWAIARAQERAGVLARNVVANHRRREAVRHQAQGEAG